MEVKTYLTFRPRVARVVRYADLLTLSLGLVSMVCSAANPPTVVVQWTLQHCKEAASLPSARR